MKNSKFSIIEIMIVIFVIILLMSITYPIQKLIRIKTKIATTRNFLNQTKVMVSGYYQDYQCLPTPGHINSNTFIDATASAKYWERIPKELYQVNQLPANITKNADLIYDPYDFELGNLKSESEFNAKFPSKDLLIPLESWYDGPISPTNLEKEELSVIAHSSKFLNYYMSGSGFDHILDGSYNKTEEKWIANIDTTFRYGPERSAMVRPYLFFGTNSSIFYNGASPEVQLTYIPSVTSWLQNKSSTYFDYLPKIIGSFDNQTYSKNLAEDKLRRLYNYNEDLNSDGSLKPLPFLKDQYTPKKITLGSDRIFFNSNFYGSTSLKDARSQKDAATLAQTNAAAQLAAAITPAQIAAAHLAIANAQALSDAADIALKNAKPGDLNNSNSTVYMRAHANNVKSLVDAFNSPILYITHVNQKKESARTYNFRNALGISDPDKDKSLNAESFLLISLGENKANDSELGENYIKQIKTGDDIIIMSGGH